MTTTHPSPLVEGPYATYDLLMTSVFGGGGGSNGKLQDLTKRLVDRAVLCGVEVSTEKSKIMTNSMKNISAYISMNCQKFEEVTSFRYLGATLHKDGTCSAEVRQNRIWGATQSALQASSSSTSLLSPPSSSMAVKHGPCLLTLRKGSRPSKQSA